MNPNQMVKDQFIQSGQVREILLSWLDCHYSDSEMVEKLKYEGFIIQQRIDNIIEANDPSYSQDEREEERHEHG